MAEKEVLNKFYEFCLTTGSERRLKKVKWIMENSRRILKKDLTKLNVEDVVRFLCYINQSDFTAWTKNDYKKIFKRFVKWHYKDLEMIEGDKVKLGFMVASKKKCFNKDKINKNTLLKPEELEKLIRTAKSLKWKAIISLAYESAFRPCELENLKWEHLTFDDSLGICRVWTHSPKTNEAREIPVKNCVVHLKRWKDEYQFPNRTGKDYVFPSQNDRSKPLGNGVIGKMFERISEEAKMRHIFPYLLRHSRICELHKKLPDKITSKFAGHSIETAELYNHIDDEDVEESMLKEIYTTEEISPEKKAEYDKKLEELKLKNEKVLKEMTELKKLLTAPSNLKNAKLVWKSQ